MARPGEETEPGIGNVGSVGDRELEVGMQEDGGMTPLTGGTQLVHQFAPRDYQENAFFHGASQSQILMAGMQGVDLGEDVSEEESNRVLKIF